MSMHSDSLSQGSLEKKAIASFQRSRGKMGRPKSFPRLKFLMRLEIAIPTS